MTTFEDFWRDYPKTYVATYQRFNLRVERSLVAAGFKWSGSDWLTPPVTIRPPKVWGARVSIYRPPAATGFDVVVERILTGKEEFPKQSVRRPTQKEIAYKKWQTLN